VKAYYGRFYNQFGSEIAETVNPNALATQNVPWTDRNGNGTLDSGELGTIPQFSAGLFPTFDQGSDRPYNDEFNVGVEHQLAGNMAVGVAYHRRHHRDGLGVIDTARPFEAFTPETRTYTDPADGQVKSIQIYKLQPQYGTLQNRVITNVEALKSTYNGVQFDFQKKMSNRWQMLAGLSFQKHQGFDHSGTFTQGGTVGACGVLNDPNCLINRDNGSVFTEIPWTFNLSGSYMTPFWDIVVAAKYNARDGDPLNRTFVFSFTNPTTTQPSATVRTVPRGTDRTETVNQFLDLRFSKRMQIGIMNLEPTLDLFNLLNANHVLGQNEAIGTTWSRPNRILTPRIIRLGLTARF
jgi:hypothetical protein